MDWLMQNGSTAVTVIFFLTFVGFGAWAYAPRNKAKMEEHGNIPFKEPRP